MIDTEIVNWFDQIAPSMQDGQLVHQAAPAPDQRGGQPRAKRGIEAFDAGGVDATVALRNADEPRDVWCRALADALNDTDYPSTGILFDRHLRDLNIVPGSQAGIPRLAALDRFAKCGLDGLHIGPEPIRTKQQGTTQRDDMHTLDQALIPPFAHRGIQPQARLDLDCHSCPQNYALRFHPDFIGLHVCFVN